MIPWKSFIVSEVKNNKWILVSVLIIYTLLQDDSSLFVASLLSWVKFGEQK